MASAGKRIRILSKTELQDLYGLPVFDQNERLFYFQISHDEKITIESFKSVESQIYFLQKRGILRVLLSLLLQENTKSNIVRKINSYARYTELKKALFEYNNIFKSVHVLNLVDSMTLRKAIRTARNRTESYHQLQGRIRKIYSGVFKGRKITTNQKSAHAVRLVANCVIAFSAIILNAVYEKMLRKGVDQAIINEFARISPIAWAHIVFTGKYN